MKDDKVMDSTVTIFPSILNTTSPTHITLGKMADYIRSNTRLKDATEYVRSTAEAGSKDALRAAKNHLVVMVPHNVTQRNSEAITRSGYNGLVLADVDGITEDEAIRLHEFFEEDPHTAMAFISPSRHGVKALFHVDNDDPSNHRQAWESVRWYVKENYGYDLDESGKDAIRCSYLISYPELSIKEPEQVLPMMDLQEPENDDVEDDFIEVPAGTPNTPRRVSGLVEPKTIMMLQEALNNATRNDVDISQGREDVWVRQVCFALANELSNSLGWHFFWGFSRLYDPSPENLKEAQKRWNYAIKNRRDPNDENAVSIGSLIKLLKDAGVHPSVAEQEDDDIVYDQFRVLTGNQAMIEGKSKPPAEPMIDGIFKERQLGIGFADTGIGKTWIANQFGYIVSSGQSLGYFKSHVTGTVLYLDFELEDDDWAERYTVDDVLVNWPDNFLRVDMNEDSEGRPEGMKMSEWYLRNIDALIDEYKPVLVVIDNLSFIGTQLEESRYAGPFMLRLKAMKKRYECSILVIAHTPKIDRTQPITLNSLAGSRQLATYLDFCFAINEAMAPDADCTHYLKTLKVRRMEKLYDHPVMKLEFIKDQPLRHFRILGTGNEWSLLRQPTAAEDENIPEHVVDAIHAVYDREGSISKTQNDADVLELVLDDGKPVSKNLIRRIVEEYKTTPEYLQKQERELDELARRVQFMHADGKSKNAIKNELNISWGRIDNLLAREVDLTNEIDFEGSSSPDAATNTIGEDQQQQEEEK